MRKSSRIYLLTFVLMGALALGCSSKSSNEGIAFTRIISGLLRDSRGNPISKALVILDDTEDSEGSRIDTVTDRDGQFSFRTRLTGPNLDFLIAEKGSLEVRVATAIREGRESKLGINIVKSGDVVDLQQSVDVALIPSDNCLDIFVQDTDLKQIALTDEHCQVATSAIVVGSRTDNISVTAIPERCPIELECPRVETSTIEQGLIIDLVTGVNDDFCDYRVEYRNKSHELLQTVKIRSTGERLVKCS